MQQHSTGHRVLEGAETVLIVSASRIVINRPYIGPDNRRRVMKTGVDLVLKPAAELFIGVEFPVAVAKRAFGANVD